MHRRFAHDHAVVFYSKTRSKCEVVHILIHKQSISPPERPSYKDAKGKPKWDIEEERKEEASNPGPLPTLVDESDDEGPPEALAADAPEASGRDDRGDVSWAESGRDDRGDVSWAESGRCKESDPLQTVFQGAHCGNTGTMARGFRVSR